MALYPPIIASSMPAFGCTVSENGQSYSGSVRIYFTLSYNSISEIKAVHLTCRRQSSNANVLFKQEKGQIEILEYTINNLNGYSIEVDDQSINRYYITLDSKNIIYNSSITYVENSNNYITTITPGFDINAFYKIQLRFSSKEGDETANFYTNNIDYFSEWSTVCIIKPIVTPTFYITDFKDQTNSTVKTNINSLMADFVGVYQASDMGQREYLKEWRMILLDSQEKQIISSNWNKVSINNYTQDNGVVVTCSLPYEFEQHIDYRLVFQIRTFNNFYSKKVYKFTYSPVTIDVLSGTLTTSINEEQGYIKVLFHYTGTTDTNVAIRRSDSKGDFKNWQDLKNFIVSGSITTGESSTDYTYYDFTAQSGIAYRYLVQARDNRGRRGTPIYDQTYVISQSNPVDKANIAQWQNAFLLEQSTGNLLNSNNENATLSIKQLKLKYDFQLSSYKTNVFESKTDTIGNKYPFIRRNGDSYYRSFGVSGLITAYMDSAELFTSKNQLDDDKINIYNEYNGQNGINISQKYDYTYERKFREKVEQFLYNSKPKLYKSMQQGNIFIKLMEVSLTPKTELGRLVYSFSATAYQIQQPTISTYNKYGIINVGTYNTKIQYTNEGIIGELNSYSLNDQNDISVFKAGLDIIGLPEGAAADPSKNIYKKYKYGEVVNNNKVSNIKVRYLRITVQSKPYLIAHTENGYQPVTQNYYSDPARSIELYQKQTIYNTVTNSNKKDVFLGTLFTLNGQQIIISPPNNVYQLDLDMIDIKSLIPAKDTAMTVDYVIDIYKQSVKKTEKMHQDIKTIGQLVGVYDSSQELIKQIKLKYNYTYINNVNEEVERTLTGVKNIFIDTQPNTQVEVEFQEKSSQPSIKTTQTYLVNQTGVLSIDPDDSSTYVSKLYIKGEKKQNDQYIPVGAFVFYTADVGRNIY